MKDNLVLEDGKLFLINENGIKEEVANQELALTLFALENKIELTKNNLTALKNSKDNIQRCLNTLSNNVKDFKKHKKMNKIFSWFFFAGGSAVTLLLYSFSKLDVSSLLQAFLVCYSYGCIDLLGNFIERKFFSKPNPEIEYEKKELELNATDAEITFLEKALAASLVKKEKLITYNLFEQRQVNLERKRLSYQAILEEQKSYLTLIRHLGFCKKNFVTQYYNGEQIENLTKEYNRYSNQYLEYTALEEDENFSLT